MKKFLILFSVVFLLFACGKDKSTGDENTPFYNIAVENQAQSPMGFNYIRAKFILDGDQYTLAPQTTIVIGGVFEGEHSWSVKVDEGVGYMNFRSGNKNINRNITCRISINGVLWH